MGDSHRSSPRKIQGGRQRDQPVQQARGMREWPARWRPGNGSSQRATREQERLARDRGTALASARSGNGIGYLAIGEQELASARSGNGIGYLTLGEQELASMGRGNGIG